jgi:hypothetical protein
MARRILLLWLCLGVLSTLSGCSVDLAPSGPSFNGGYGRGAYYGEPYRGDDERRNLEKERAYQQWERRRDPYSGGYGDLN